MGTLSPRRSQRHGGSQWPAHRRTVQLAPSAQVEAETGHLARMEDAERRWPEVLAVAEREYCLKVSAEIEAAL